MGMLSGTAFDELRLSGIGSVKNSISAQAELVEAREPTEDPRA